MYDEQIRRILEKTFREVDVLVREVQEKKRIENTTTGSFKLRKKKFRFPIRKIMILIILSCNAGFCPVMPDLNILKK